MLYEWRTYAAAPDSAAAFMRLFRERALPIRVKYPGRLVGFWTTAASDDGGTMCHLWEYESFDVRAAARAALSEDPEWMQDYASDALALLATQSVTFLALGSGSVKVMRSRCDLLLQICCRPGRGPYLVAEIGSWLSQEPTVFIGESGDPNALRVLLPDWVDPKPVTERLLRNDSVLSWTCRHLLPAAFSPAHKAGSAS